MENSHSERERQMDVAQQFRLVNTTKRILQAFGDQRAAREAKIKWWAVGFAFAIIAAGLTAAVVFVPRLVH